MLGDGVVVERLPTNAKTVSLAGVSLSYLTVTRALIFSIVTIVDSKKQVCPHVCAYLLIYLQIRFQFSPKNHARFNLF